MPTKREPKPKQEPKESTTEYTLSAVARLRTITGLSQAQFARRCAINLRTYKSLEKRQHEAKKEQLKAEKKRQEEAEREKKAGKDKENKPKPKPKPKGLSWQNAFQIAAATGASAGGLMRNEALCPDSDGEFTREDYERFLKPLERIHTDWKHALAEQVMDRFDLLLEQVRRQSLNQFIPEIMALGSQIDDLCRKHGVSKDEKDKELEPCVHKIVDYLAYDVEHPDPHRAIPGDDLLHRLELSKFLRKVLDADLSAKAAKNLHPKDRTKTQPPKKNR